ncbi:MAG: glycosyltransferase [Desulfovibrio sp.]|nr:glycosyltransferase [Desulfovibrio sp.]
MVKASLPQRIFSALATLQRHFRKYGLRFGLWRLYTLLTHPDLKGSLFRAVTPAKPQTAFQRFEPQDWQGSVVVFDHSVGGGANHYCAELVQGLVQRTTVLVATFDNTTLRYVLRGESTFGTSNHTFDSVEELLCALDASRPSRLLHNSLYAWEHAFAVADWMVRKKAEHVPLDIFLHDFFFLCPTVVMLNQAFRFCGVVTDAAACDRCLEKNFFRAPYTANNITQWRSVWGRVLHSANSITVPHQSMLALLRKIYPGIEARGQVKPHTAQSAAAYALPQTATTVIAIVGSIGLHKGSLLVYELADILHKTQGLVARIVVIGTLTPYRPHPNILVTGSYRSGDLPQLLAAHQVTVGLFPSICPETFSYVCHELMALKLPLVAFPLGAQGDCVGQYAHGTLAGGVDARSALTAIEALERRRLGGAMPWSNSF